MWKVFRTVAHAVSCLGAGFLAGVLAVFVVLSYIGAFRAVAQPITIRPVIDLRTPTSTPPPTTPSPVPTLTEEQRDDEIEIFRLLEKTPVQFAWSSFNLIGYRGREIILELQPDYGERPTVTCPDCYRVEWYVIKIGGPSEGPWIVMALDLDRHETRKQRRMRGVQEPDPFGGFRADRG